MEASDSFKVRGKMRDVTAIQTRPFRVAIVLSVMAVHINEISICIGFINY